QQYGTSSSHCMSVWGIADALPQAPAKRTAFRQRAASAIIPASNPQSSILNPQLAPLSRTLSRRENQARGLGQYAIDFVSGRFPVPAAKVVQRLEVFHRDSVV